MSDKTRTDKGEDSSLLDFGAIAFRKESPGILQVIHCRLRRAFLHTLN